MIIWVCTQVCSSHCLREHSVALMSLLYLEEPVNLVARMLVTLFLFFSLSSGALVYAQNDPGQWVGDLYLMGSYPGEAKTRPIKDRVHILVDEKDVIHRTIPNLTKAKDFSVSDSHNQSANFVIWHVMRSIGSIAFGTWHHNDAFYAMACATGLSSESPTDDGQSTTSYFTREDGSEFLRWFFAEQKDDDDDGWQYLGFYDTEPDADLWKAIPCDNNRFIIIAFKPVSYDGSKRTPFFRITLPNNDKKEFRLDSYIDYGQDELRDYMSDDEISRLVIDSDIIVTDKFATLVNNKSGLYWIFSKEKASLVKSGSIFNKLKANQLDSNSFEHPVLCANPEKDGTVLISAQDEDYLLKAKMSDDDILKELNELSRSGYFKSFEEGNEWFGRRRREREKITGTPFIVWYRIYPETKKVEKLTSPPEGGSLLKDASVNTKWRPMPDGSVKMGGAHELEWPTPEETKKEPNKISR